MRRAAIIVVFLSVVSSPLYSQVYLHPKVSTGEKMLKAVVLVPPTAEMIAEGVLGRDYKEKEAKLLAGELAGIVSRALKSRSWSVDDTSLAEFSLLDREELKWLVGGLRARHEKMTGERLSIKGKNVPKGKYSLGSKVAPLAELTGGDTLVFVHAVGRRPTKGTVVASYIYYGATALIGLLGCSTCIDLRISFVDARSGDFLCFLKVSGADESRIIEELRKIPHKNGTEGKSGNAKP